MVLGVSTEPGLGDPWGRFNNSAEVRKGGRSLVLGLRPNARNQPNLRMEIFPIAEVRTRLESHDGGWEVVHESPNLEVGVLVRIAPTPDPPVRHTADEVYVVLAGEATLEAEGESRRLKPGDTAFVAVGKEHHFVDYERISVLVLFARRG
jgi:mannose-6-phosphate isomerase-like protein (cupin superfamily)